MHKILVAVIGSFFLLSAVAEEPRIGEAIETETFKIALPPGWKETKREQQTLYLGSGKQTAEISIARIAGGETLEEKTQARLRLKEKLKKMVARNSQNSDYLIAQKVQEKQVVNGDVVISTKLRTLDKKSFLHQYGVVGPSTALIVTVEGPAAELFTADLFEYYVMTSMQWK